jgi:ABC-2 type transport system permease protein
MRKYWHVINIAIQNTLVYRVNFLFRVLFGFIPLFALISLWRTIYEGQSSDIGGYTLHQMVSYYLLMTIVDALTAVNEDDWQIAADIRDGNISQFLLKPISYPLYRLCLFFSGRLVYASVAFVPIVILIFFLRQYFLWPADWTTFLFFGVSMVMTALLQFFLSYTLALMAFWLLEVSTLIFIVFAFEYIAGGHLFPIDILPAPLASFLMLTPFPYQLYFPVSVYVGKITGPALYQGLAVQAAWVVAAFFLARFVWSRGIRKYSAVGG